MPAIQLPNLSHIAITPAEALAVTGLSDPRTAAVNARTQIRRGKYPYPLTQVPGGGRRKYVVLVRDIEAALGLTESNAPAVHSEPAEQPQRKRGRPRLSRGAGQGVGR